MEIVNLFEGIPNQERPRERLESHGAKALANYELLAIILRSGNRNKSVIEISLNILRNLDSLYRMRDITLEELMVFDGIGKIKAIEILAVIEFGLRIARSSQIKEGTVVSSQWIGQYLMEELGTLDQENVIAIYLNTKNEIIKKEIVFIGGLNSSVVHPREIFKHAVRCSAARIIMGHNHPSGNPTPSEADYLFTTRMIKAGDIMGIELLDHIVIGDNSFVSLREEGFF